MNFTKKFRVFLNNLLRSKRILLDFWAEVNENRAYYVSKIGKLCSIMLIGASAAVLFWECYKYRKPEQAEIRVFYGVICSFLCLAGAYWACLYEKIEKWFIVDEKQIVAQKENNG